VARRLLVLFVCNYCRLVWVLTNLDVRYVLHYDYQKTSKAIDQQIGRAAEMDKMLTVYCCIWLGDTVKNLDFYQPNE